MYFVMIHTEDPNSPARPLLKPDAVDCTDIAFFDTEDEVFTAAEGNAYARLYDYDVFELGNGVI